MVHMSDWHVICFSLFLALAPQEDPVFRLQKRTYIFWIYLKTQLIDGKSFTKYMYRAMKVGLRNICDSEGHLNVLTKMFDRLNYCNM